MGGHRCRGFGGGPALGNPRSFGFDRCRFDKTRVLAAFRRGGAAERGAADIGVPAATETRAPAAFRAAIPL